MPRSRTVEIFEDSEGKFRYHVKARNGEIVSQSQAYTTRRGARRAGIRNEPNAAIVTVRSAQAVANSARRPR